MIGRKEVECQMQQKKLRFLGKAFSDKANLVVKGANILCDENFCKNAKIKIVKRGCENEDLGRS